MSDNPPPIIPDSGKRSYLVGISTSDVPTSYTSLSRIGAVTDDETLLPQDPANTPLPGPRIGSYPAFNPGTLTYTVDTAHIVAPAAYMRLGAPAPYETWLQTDPNLDPATARPPEPPPVPAPFDQNGVLLHTNQTLQLFAPTISVTAAAIDTSADSITQWAGQSLSAIYRKDGDDGSRMVSVERLGSQPSGITSNSSVQVTDAYATTIGNQASSVIGNVASYYMGNSTALGAGSLLYSNMGLTSNVFGGQVINVTNGSVSIDGIWETNYGDTTTFAPKEIVLAVAATTATSVVSSSIIKMNSRINYLIAGGMALVGGGAAAIAFGGSNAQSPSRENRDATQASLNNYMTRYEQWMEGLLVIIGCLEVMTIVTGMVANSQFEVAQGTETASIRLTNGSLELFGGGTRMKLNSEGLSVSTPGAVDLAEVIAKAVAVDASNIISQASSQRALATGSSSSASSDDIVELDEDDESVPSPAIPGMPSINLNGDRIVMTALNINQKVKLD